jgi:hypothetical protein
MAVETITVPKARKDVECSKGTPDCESDKIKLKVTRKTNPDGDAPGEISVSYDPEVVANNIIIRKKSGPTNVTKKVGPIPCMLCESLFRVPPLIAPGSARGSALMGDRRKELETWTDERFEAKHGLSKRAFAQMQLDMACDEYMGGPGLGHFYASARINPQGCAKPFVMRTGSLTIILKGSIKVYWFTSNCIRSEKTIEKTKSFDISNKTFSIPSILGGTLGEKQKGADRSLFGTPVKCPEMSANIFCGACYYKSIPQTMFAQPECVDVDSAQGTLGYLAEKNAQEMYSDPAKKKRIQPFAEAKAVRDELAKDISAKMKQQVRQLVQDLVNEALAMSRGREIDGQQVCGIGYELVDSIQYDYKVRTT